MEVFGEEGARLRVSIGVPAHNEEANIQKLLGNLTRQEMPDGTKLDEILVVVSGADRTLELVKDFQGENPIVRLIRDEGPLTKKFNTILENTKGEVLVIVNADTLPRPGTIGLLIQPIEDKTVGSVVGRAMPTNDPESFWGYVHHLFFKCNYLPEFLRVDFEGACSFRHDLVKHVAMDVIDYESYVDALIRGKGYKVVYAPSAITYMKAPDNLRDFLNQRRRTFFMHLQTQRKLDSPMPRLDFSKTLFTVLKNSGLTPKKLFWSFAMMVLSAYCYLLARYDFAAGKSYFMWKVVPSTKTVNAESNF